MISRMIAIVSGFFLVTAPLVAQEPPRPATIEHFEKKIRPLFLAHCSRCHGADPAKLKGGLDLTTKAGLLSGGDTGPAVVPGDPERSTLIQSVRYLGDLKMPPKGKLSDREIADLTDWVKNGAPWPESPARPAPSPNPVRGSGPRPLFTDEQKTFWSFQPIRDPAIPSVTYPSGAPVSHPVDAFLQAKRQEKGLAPAKPADKRTLIRRVTFDLTGLPPTPEEVDVFLHDQSDDAFAKVVDRLLASPAYGERWARHWLDIARYADSNGLDENTAFANAWRYRDYVVRSFNADKPFDRFLQEQLAGDLLPPSPDAAEQADRFIALGYLAIGPKLLAEPDKQKMLLDIADEQLDTLGKGVMGLTLGCARCHDHKFDPIPTRDYYSLLGIFTSTRTMQNLNTVAKAFERSLGGPEPPEAAATRAKLDQAYKNVRELEREFGRTPEADKAKRQEIHEKAEKVRAEIKQLEKQLVPQNHALSVEDGSPAAYGTQPRNLYVQIRGNYLTPGEEAPAVFLRILEGETPKPFVASTKAAVSPHEPGKIRYGTGRVSSGRLELARWLTDSRHPLTARVFVNRVWKHHFGEGIVRSPDNFGLLGERPSHPELLDWLATRFRETGWSIKRLHRLILLTNSYQMSSAFDPNAATADPENRWLWRYPRRRLEVEAIRDAMLAVAGNLDPTVGGTIFPHGNFEYVRQPRYDSPRRSLYLPVIRNNVYGMFQTFDFPDPSTLNGHRVSTVVAPQALFLMNSPFAAQQAAVFADRLWQHNSTSDTGRIHYAYRLAFSREATSEEIATILRFLDRYTATLTSDGTPGTSPDRRAWAAWCQTLFASSEFIHLE